MPIHVSIPTPLRPLTDNLDTVEVDAPPSANCSPRSTRNIPVRRAPARRARQRRRFVNIYVNGEDIRFLKTRKRPFKAGEEVSIVPAIAGG